MLEERWKAIPGWEGWYEASTMGRVRSVSRVITDSMGRQRSWAGTYLAPRTGSKGYLYVGLKKNGNDRQRSVHQLVLLTFKGPRPAGMISRHRNGIAADCRLENLEYATQSVNMFDRRIHGTDPNVNKTKCPNGHPYEGRNLVMNVNGGRECRTCICDRSRRYRLRKAAQA